MNTANVYICGNRYNVLVAASEFEKEKGLMDDKYPSYKMAFPYSSPRYMSFWMKNTHKDLDIIFCKNNVIIKIVKGEAFSQNLVGKVVSDLVVELPYGTCAQDKIEVGNKIYIL